MVSQGWVKRNKRRTLLVDVFWRRDLFIREEIIQNIYDTTGLWRDEDCNVTIPASLKSKEIEQDSTLSPVLAFFSLPSLLSCLTRERKVKNRRFSLRCTKGSCKLCKSQSQESRYIFWTVDECNKWQIVQSLGKYYYCQVTRFIPSIKTRYLVFKKTVM